MVLGWATVSQMKVVVRLLLAGFEIEADERIGCSRWAEVEEVIAN